MNGFHVRESLAALCLLAGWLGVMLVAMRHCS